MQLILANQKRVEVSKEEMQQFITVVLITNPYWRQTRQLSEDEVQRFVARASTDAEIRKVARYTLIFAENVAFSAYLFDKADGIPDRTRELNLPAIKKLRDLYQKMLDNRQTMMDLCHIMDQMLGICLRIGVDPL